MFNNNRKKSKVDGLTKVSTIIRRKKVLESRDLWIDYFTDILSCLINLSDRALINEELIALVEQASITADKALKDTEERFPGL